MQLRTVLDKREVEERWEDVRQLACWVVNLSAFATEPTIFRLETRDSIYYSTSPSTTRFTSACWKYDAHLIHDFVQTSISSAEENASTVGCSNTLHVNAVGWEREERLGQKVHLGEVCGETLLRLRETHTKQHDVNGSCHAEEVLNVRLEDTCNNQRNWTTSQRQVLTTIIARNAFPHLLLVSRDRHSICFHSNHRNRPNQIWNNKISQRHLR